MKQLRNVSKVLVVLVLVISASSFFVGCKQPNSSDLSTDSGESSLVDVDGFVKGLNSTVSEYEDKVQGSMTSFEKKLEAYTSTDKKAIKDAYDAFKEAYSNNSEQLTNKAKALTNLLEFCNDTGIKEAGLLVLNNVNVTSVLNHIATGLAGIKKPLTDARKVIEEKGNEKIKSAWIKVEQAYLKMFQSAINGMISDKDSNQAESDKNEQDIKTASQEFKKALESNKTVAQEIMAKLEVLKSALMLI